MNDAQVLTETQTPQATAKAVQAGIDALKALAEETLRREFHAIADTAGRDNGATVGRRLKRHNILDELIGNSSWLARDLVDVLLKIATENDPHSAMGSDIPTRIREAEIRLELLRELSR